jgi:hypothetical protein
VDGRNATGISSDPAFIAITERNDVSARIIAMPFSSWIKHQSSRHHSFFLGAAGAGSVTAGQGTSGRTSRSAFLAGRVAARKSPPGTWRVFRYGRDQNSILLANLNHHGEVHCFVRWNLPTWRTQMRSKNALMSIQKHLRHP